MNLRQYQRCSQAPSLTMNFQYDGSQALSPQTNDHMTTFDGLPRFPLENELLSTWPPTINNYNITTQMPSTQSPTEWASPIYTSPNLEKPSPANDYGYYYHSSPVFPRHPQDDRLSLGPTFDGVSRTWQLNHDPRVPRDSTSAPSTYGPSQYMRDQNSDEASGFPSLGSDQLYDCHDGSRDFARLSINHSPKIEDDAPGINYSALGGTAHSAMQLSEASDDSRPSSREMTAVEFEDPMGVDEPYAKLIYRALMSAPNHAMVLQEIYQWFRDNTTKGSSDTKGWMNSIRHNLSMNAVSWLLLF